MAQVFAQELPGISIAIGLLFAAFAFYIAYDREASTRATLIATVVCFLLPYLIGRVALYAFAGG